MRCRNIPHVSTAEASSDPGTFAISTNHQAVLVWCRTGASSWWGSNTQAGYKSPEWSPSLPLTAKSHIGFSVRIFQCLTSCQDTYIFSKPISKRWSVFLCAGKTRPQTLRWAHWNRKISRGRLWSWRYVALAVELSTCGASQWSKLPLIPNIRWEARWITLVASPTSRLRVPLFYLVRSSCTKYDSIGQILTIFLKK